jgi:pimeloyl-ACP methyl ester carboxylesterase
VGDHDWVRLDHALETFQRIPGAELAILPDAGHFTLHEEQEKLLPVIENFLNAPLVRLPFATTTVAYQPGCTR